MTDIRSIVTLLEGAQAAIQTAAGMIGTALDEIADQQQSIAIHTEEECRAALAEIDTIFHAELDTPEYARLTELTDAVIAYEEEHP